ncbi:MAG: plastocyanin/azurin family copper-binding protein [Chloroflexi bacterium]|nr:plastocyanin/azurin family copper-binding protein [Chloroflexota bacterium]
MAITTVSRRQFLKQSGVLLGVAASGWVIAACGGGGSPTQAPAGNTGGAVTLDIASKGEELFYDKEKLEAPAGSKITLNLKNNSTALEHNWVLVKPGTQEAVAQAGLQAGEANAYVKEGDPNIIAHTKMAKAGQTESVTFDAPAPGDYPYLCTFPGHNVLMKGTLTIK